MHHIEFTLFSRERSALLIGAVALFTFLVMAYVSFAAMTGTLLPVSDGAYVQWTPSAGSTHYVLVDESACNGTADYVYTNTVGYRDSYGISLASIPDAATITALEIKPCASRNKTGGGSSTMDVFYRWDGVNSADAGAYALTGTTPVGLAATTFSGLSLDKGPTSALQIGAVLSAGTKGARLSRIAVVATYTALVAPSALDAVNVSGSRNDVSWTDNSSNEDGFKVERSQNNASGPFTQIATTTVDVVSYSDTGLTSDKTYYYRVRAFNGGGNSAYSNTDYAITATVVPNVPSGLTAVASSSDAILNWNDNSVNEEGVKVERGTDGLNFSEIATKGIDVTTHTDPALAPGTYYYRVRAFNAIGNSAYSTSTSVVIP